MGKVYKGYELDDGTHMYDIRMISDEGKKMLNSGLLKIEWRFGGISKHEYGMSGVRGMDRVSSVEDVEL